MEMQLPPNTNGIVGKGICKAAARGLRCLEGSQEQGTALVL